jgi:hypothetical protein
LRGEKIMKKLFIIVLTLFLMIGITGNLAAQPLPKAADVSLTSSVETANLGETVTLTAITMKKGSDYTDEWIGATKVGTVLNHDGYYVSTAEFKADVTVNVQYRIIMTAGKSKVSFTGQSETTVVVSKPAPAVVVGIEVKNIRPDPQLAGEYLADIYAVLSDGTLRPEGSMFFSIPSGQTSKTLYLTVEGKRYTYIVNIP